MSHNGLYISLINTTRWRVLRAKALSTRPLCEVCLKAERVTPATEVHHIRPVESTSDYSAMTSLAYDPNNLLCLCHACHANIHKGMQSHTKEAVKENRKREMEHFIDVFLMPKKG